MKPSLLFAVALATASPACGASLPLDAYRDGRYPAAADELRAAEHETKGWSEQDRARYSLYRGLTHLALGDAAEADRWLKRAKRALDHHPRWFDASERGALLSAWRSTGRMPGETR